MLVHACAPICRSKSENKFSGFPSDLWIHWSPFGSVLWLLRVVAMRCVVFGNFLKIYIGVRVSFLEWQ